jgi:AraC-like DNA-binding protein
MNYLYEYSDLLNRPYEAFSFDTLYNDFPVRPHFHPYVELVYMLDGSMFASSDDKEYYLTEGDMIIFFRDSVHSMSASSVKGARFRGIKFDIARLMVSTNYTPRLQTLLTAAKKQGARVKFSDDEIELNELGDFFARCDKELNEMELGFDIAVHARLCLLITRLIRLWKAEGIDFSNVGEYVTRDELSLQNILEYIDRHLDENLRVEELARRCNMSYSHFARSFKEMYGRSCKDYLEMLRVEKAEELLKFTDYALSDIAQELGYSDLSHFIRVYRKLKGVTPGMIRGNHAKQDSRATADMPPDG